MEGWGVFVDRVSFCGGKVFQLMVSGSSRSFRPSTPLEGEGVSMRSSLPSPLLGFPCLHRGRLCLRGNDGLRGGRGVLDALTPTLSLRERGLLCSCRGGWSGLLGRAFVMSFGKFRMDGRSGRWFDRLSHERDFHPHPSLPPSRGKGLLPSPRPSL